MRVAYVCTDPGVPVFGNKGCSRHVQEIISALQTRGAQVDLFATRFGGERPSSVSDVACHRLRLGPHGDTASREQALVDMNDQVGARLQRHGPYDLVYERYSLWSYAAMEFARGQEARSVLEVNAPLVQEQRKHRQLVNQQTAVRLSRRCFQSAQTIVAVSEEVADHLRDDPFARSKTHVVANGVNPHTFQPKRDPEYRVVARPLVIGFVGSLKPWHGLSILAEAFAILHQINDAVELRIVGSGPQRDALLKQLVALPRSVQAAIECVGAITPQKVPAMLRDFDIGVAPYPALDSFYFSPLKILEYMAAGLPVVASRIGQIPRLIEDFGNGLLCDPGCPHSLAQALLRLCENPDLRWRLGTAARRRVECYHTWDSVVGQILGRCRRPAVLAESES